MRVGLVEVQPVEVAGRRRVSDDLHPIDGRLGQGRKIVADPQLAPVEAPRQALLRLLMEISWRVLGRHPHHPELAGAVDELAGIVPALVLDNHDVGGSAGRGAALDPRHLAPDRQLVAGHDRPRVLEALFCLEQVLARRQHQALAQVGAGPQGGGKGRGSHHAPVARRARSRFLEVDGVGLADRLGEAPDGALLHFVHRGFRFPPCRAAIDHVVLPYLPAGKSRTLIRPGSEPCTSGAAWTTVQMVALSPGVPPGISTRMPGSPISSISSRGCGAPRAMVRSRMATSFPSWNARATCWIPTMPPLGTVNPSPSMSSSASTGSMDSSTSSTSKIG